jgi:hypothetical protein
VTAEQAEHDHSPTTWKFVALINSFVYILHVVQGFLGTMLNQLNSTSGHKLTRTKQPPHAKKPTAKQKGWGATINKSVFQKKLWKCSLRLAILGRSSVCFGH